MNCYEVKVLTDIDKTYLWGSEGLEIALDCGAILLHLRVDDFGEEIQLGWRNDTSDPFKDLGKLKPGESFTVPLKGLRGVFARCVEPEFHTKVECTLLYAHESA